MQLYGRSARSGPAVSGAARAVGTGPCFCRGPTGLADGAAGVQAISHHLKMLREAGLVGSERRGTWVYYRVMPAALARLSSLLQAPADSLAAEAAR